MLEINSNKDKNITFEVSLSGITPKELNGHFRILVDGIEYGFPAEITESSIAVSIPSLKTIIHRPLRESEKLQSRLDVYGNDYYLKPWSGEVKIKNPVMIEAKIVESNEDTKKKPMIEATIVSSDKPKSVIQPKKKVEPIKEVKVSKPKAIRKKITSEAITTDHLFKYMEKMGTTNKRAQEVILETCTGAVGNSDMKKLFGEVFKYYKQRKPNNE